MGTRIRDRECGRALCGSDAFLMMPATQAASQLLMDSTPSFEMRRGRPLGVWGEAG